jgi:NAD(P)-dependent dehydrogenase (short-subunit alcohol dehydrogenase family)
MEMRLAGRVCVVTGAGQGIGRGIAIRLAEEGADVAVVDVATDSGEETARLVRALGRHAVAVPADVSQKAQVEAMVTATLGQFGKIDVLVNNAGVMMERPLLEISEDDWDRMLDINLKGPFLCSQAVVKYFLKSGTKGKIVNLASVESTVAFPNSVPYAASKGGVAMLTKAMSLDLAAHGITVNAVGPGSTDTGRNFRDPARRAEYEAIIPMHRLGTPRDVANAIVFLASDDADYVTGHILYVDGGFLSH